MPWFRKKKDDEAEERKRKKKKRSLRDVKGSISRRKRMLDEADEYPTRRRRKRK